MVPEGRLHESISPLQDERTHENQEVPGFTQIDFCPGVPLPLDRDQKVGNDSEEPACPEGVDLLQEVSIPGIKQHYDQPEVEDVAMLQDIQEIPLLQLPIQVDELEDEAEKPIGHFHFVSWLLWDVLFSFLLLSHLEEN